MGNRWQLRVTRPGGKQVPNWERGVIHISTGSSTPRPRTPTPLYRHLICRGRGGMTTNGVHLNLPLELSNQPGHPSVIASGKEVLTCAHCVPSGTTPAVASLSNPHQFIHGKVLQLWPTIDIALLEFPHSVGSPVTLRESTACAVGNGAFVVGFPLGEAEKTLVSAHIASITTTELKIDASVNHGNSGGHSSTWMANKSGW